MLSRPRSQLIIAALALIAFAGSPVLAGSKQSASQRANASSGNDVAMESITIVHEGIRPPSTQSRNSNHLKQKAAPAAPSNHDNEWKYLNVRRF